MNVFIPLNFVFCIPVGALGWNGARIMSFGEKPPSWVLSCPHPITGVVTVDLFYISPVASGAPEKAEMGSEASQERCGSCGIALGGPQHPLGVTASLGGNGGAAISVFSVKQGADWLVCRFNEHTLYSSALGMSFK